MPTSRLQEDHVSMGWGAARKLDQIITNTEKVVAVELMCAAQGVEQRQLDPAPGPDIERIADLVGTGIFSFSPD